MFWCALLFVHSSFATILMGEERVGCFASFVFLVSRDCYVSRVCLQFVIILAIFENQILVFLRMAILHEFYCKINLRIELLKGYTKVSGSSTATRFDVESHFI